MNTDVTPQFRCGIRNARAGSRWRPIHCPPRSSAGSRANASWSAGPGTCPCSGCRAAVDRPGSATTVAAVGHPRPGHRRPRRPVAAAGVLGRLPGPARL